MTDVAALYAEGRGRITSLVDDAPAPEGPPVGMLEAPSFELMRACTGRRSASQIAGYSWTVDPAPYVAAFQFGPFTTSGVDIAE